PRPPAGGRRTAQHRRAVGDGRAVPPVPGRRSVLAGRAGAVPEPRRGPLRPGSGDALHRGADEPAPRRSAHWAPGGADGRGRTAASVTLWALRTRRALFALSAVAALLCAADVVLYVHYFNDIVLAVPLVQRLALLTGVSWIAACAFAVLYEVDAAAVAPDASETGSPRATETAAARSPTTLRVVRHMSRKRSTPRMSPSPSGGM